MLDGLKIKWDELLRALVLVRLGQELGTDSDAARAVAGVVELWTKIASALPLGMGP